MQQELLDIPLLIRPANTIRLTFILSAAKRSRRMPAGTICMPDHQCVALSLRWLDRIRRQRVYCAFFDGAGFS